VDCDFSCIKTTKYLTPPNAWVSIEPHIFECMISSTLVAQVLPPCRNTWRCWFVIKQLWQMGGFLIHHKLHGSQFDNNMSKKFSFHRFIWNRHRCHSFTCIVWTSILYALFRHKCCVSIRIVYTQKSCLHTNNAWHLCVNDMNP
jgi:hypothetical protein